MEQQRISSLDSLRGIAACAVAFIWHFQHFKPADGSPFGNVLKIFYEQGWLAVELFFCISGFVFCYVYEQKILSEKISIRNFILLRLARLYPLFLITLAVITGLQFAAIRMEGATFVYPNFTVYHFLQNLLFLQMGWFTDGFSFNGPSWSLSVEMVCYILFFFILIHFRKKQQHLAAYIIMILIGLTIYKTHWNFPLLNIWMARGFICFFTGALSYHIIIPLQKSKAHGWIAGGLTLILTGFVFLYYRYGAKPFGDFQLVFSIFIAPALLVISLCSVVFKRILEAKPLVYLGELSFSVYLWHFPVQAAIHLISKKTAIQYSSYGFFFAYIAVTLLVSCLSYELFEKKINAALKRRINKPLLSAPHAAPACAVAVEQSAR